VRLVRTMPLGIRKTNQKRELLRRDGATVAASRDLEPGTPAERSLASASWWRLEDTVTLAGKGTALLDGRPARARTFTIPKSLERQSRKAVCLQSQCPY
jgi:hypothetical protein